MTAQVTVTVSPEYLAGEPKADVKVCIPVELLCVDSDILVLGESLHPNWGYWGGTEGSNDVPFRYKKLSIAPSEVENVIQAIKAYAQDVRDRQAQLDKNGKVYVLEL